MKQIFLILIFISFFFSVNFAQNKLSVQFGKESGKYDGPIRLSLESDVGANIFYTLDGNRPTAGTNKYGTPLIINKTTVVRAVAYKNGKASKVYTNTYFVRENTNYMLLSLSVEPAVLKDPISGWLHKGPNADSIYPFANANYWSRREVSADFEIFESDGERVFSDRIGLKLFGGMSRIFEQKSFAIATRTIYGSERRIQYQLFPDKKHKSYKHLVVRNAGSDCEKAHFRDVFMTSLMNGVDIEKQSYQPCILYINGQYWGIYFIRDKVNRHFIEYSTDVDDDSLDLIEHQDRIKYGNISHYNAMLQYMRNNDLAEAEHFKYIESQMEIQNFMDLQVAQIYFDNHDAGGNIKFWRPQTPEGRWRWVLYDTDWGFGLQDPLAYQFNTLDLHTQADAPGWPNPAWSTFILRNLLKNKDFENRFVNRFADYINTRFETEAVLDSLDRFKTLLAPEYDRHAKKWGYVKNIWTKHINTMKEFARKRPSFMQTFLQKKFDVGEVRDIELVVKGNGTIKVNQHFEVSNQLKGQYFEKIPISLSALPSYGYAFSHWKTSSGVVKDAELKYSLKEQLNKLVAVFKKSNHQLDGKIIFNEIAPNNKKTADWLELYNTSKELVRLNKWTFRDALHSFEIDNVSIPPNGYLVICKDTAKFKRVFPKVSNIVGNINFGISKKKEMLRLFADNGALIDSIFYDIEPLDSIFVLSLPHPTMDNSDERNWNLITGIGSPDRANPGYEQKLQEIKKQEFLMIGGGVLLGLGILFFGWMGFRRRRRGGTDE